MQGKTKGSTKQIPRQQEPESVLHECIHTKKGGCCECYLFQQASLCVFFMSFRYFLALCLCFGGSSQGCNWKSLQMRPPKRLHSINRPIEDPHPFHHPFVSHYPLCVSRSCLSAELFSGSLFRPLRSFGFFIFIRWAAVPVAAANYFHSTFECFYP